jgi:hypothetical protein
VADQPELDAAVIVQLVDANPNLQALGIPFSSATDASVRHATAQLGMHLRILDLEGCGQVSPLVLKHLHNDSPNLEVLDISHLSWSESTSEQYLAKVLVHCQNLRHVGFANTRFAPVMREALISRFGPAGGLIWRGWECKRFLEISKTDFSVARAD